MGVGDGTTSTCSTSNETAQKMIARATEMHILATQLL